MIDSCQCNAICVYCVCVSVTDAVFLAVPCVGAWEHRLWYVCCLHHLTLSSPVQSSCTGVSLSYHCCWCW